MAFPFLIFAIVCWHSFDSWVTNLIAALIFKGWVEFFRVVRGEMMSEKPKNMRSSKGHRFGQPGNHRA
jgi:peptide/nickel transport system permease protein